MLLADEAGEERRLLALLDEFLAGASIADATVHDRFWAPELIYTSSGGARYGKAEIMQGMTAGADQEADQEADGESDGEAGGGSAAELPGTTYWAEDQQVMVMGDTAVVAFRLMAETPQEDGSSAQRQEYFNTGTFRLRDGVWQAVAWQATRIPAAAAD